MATLVLAIAAVAGTPPKKGSRIFPIPCAVSSISALSFSFFIRPAEAPQSRDSISPRAAMETAGTTKLPNSLKFILVMSSLSARKIVFGISPTTLTSKLKIKFAAVARIIAASEPGQYWLSF